MERLQLTKENMRELAEKAAIILRSGGVVLYPTDTLYGLGADALSDSAVGKIYSLKGRDEHKPIHALVSDKSMIERYATVSETAGALIDKFLPGALTIILKKRGDVNSGIAHDRETMGFRIPAHAFCIELARAFGGPITTTSANSAGAQSPRTVTGILEQLDASAIDLIIDAGELAESLPSTVVDISQGEVHILREGAVSEARLRGE